MYKYVIDDFCKCNYGDIIYIVGDYITFCNSSKLDVQTLGKMFEMLKPVKAEIRLIIGNNEERIIKELFNNSFTDFFSFCIRYNIKVMKKT